MASGALLAEWDAALGNIFTGTNAAQPDVRNLMPVLAFDTTTQEIAIYRRRLDQAYGGGGITVYLLWAAASATTGTIGWDVAIEAIGTAQDIDADSFASAITVTAATVSGTAGIPIESSAAVSSGANMDSLAAGELFRLRVRRDVATDTAAGDAHLLSVWVKET